MYHDLFRRNFLSEQSIKLSAVSLQLERNKDIINHLSEKVMLLDPVNTLNRGYSITRLKGKALTDSFDLVSGMQIETQFAKGNVISTIEKKK